MNGWGNAFDMPTCIVRPELRYPAYSAVPVEHEPLTTHVDCLYKEGGSRQFRGIEATLLGYWTERIVHEVIIGKFSNLSMLDFLTD